jgi:hypothetical protein
MAVEGITTVDDLDETILAEVCVDVLASKVAQRSDVRDLRGEIEDAIRDTEGGLS